MGSEPGKRGPYKKTEARRKQIIAAALQVFSTSGYRAGSLKEIGSRIGIDASSILHHFPTKEALLQAVLEDKRAHDSQGAAELETIDPAIMPQRMLELAEFNDGVPGLIALYAILSAESTTRDHPSAEYFREHIERTRRDFRRGFQRMADAGLLAEGITADYAAVSTFALWDGIQLHWLITPESASVTETLRRHLESITLVKIQ